MGGDRQPDGKRSDPLRIPYLHVDAPKPEI